MQNVFLKKKDHIIGEIFLVRCIVLYTKDELIITPIIKKFAKEIEDKTLPEDILKLYRASHVEAKLLELIDAVKKNEIPST